MLADAPAIFDEKRRLLISEVQGAEAARTAAADRWPTPRMHWPRPTARPAPRSRRSAPRVRRPPAPRSGLKAPSGGSTDIAHEIHEMLECEPDAVAALAGIAPETTLPDVADVEADLERLRRDRERLGAVNLRAEEELREIETQHTHAHRRARRPRGSHQAVAPGHHQPEQGSARTAAPSFEVVNNHFQRLFTELFGGGTAELSSSSTTIRWKPAWKSSPSRPARSPRRCRCSPAASRR